jgi:hypothetical protein
MSDPKPDKPAGLPAILFAIAIWTLLLGTPALVAFIVTRAP